jgi:hypothetical protein
MPPCRLPDASAVICRSWAGRVYKPKVGQPIWDSGIVHLTFLPVYIAILNQAAHTVIREYFATISATE